MKLADLKRLTAPLVVDYRGQTLNVVYFTDKMSPAYRAGIPNTPDGDISMLLTILESWDLTVDQKCIEDVLAPAIPNSIGHQDDGRLRIEPATMPEDVRMLFDGDGVWRAPAAEEQAAPLNPWMLRQLGDSLRRAILSQLFDSIANPPKEAN